MRHEPPSSTPKLTLFCLPHAGGSAAYYADFGSHFSGDIRLRPLELAGRGRRCREPLETEVEAMVGDFWKSILPEARRAPYALFGHSMGALLAFLCAVRASEDGEPLPKALFLSACPPPDEMGAELAGVGLTPEETWRHAVELGGIPESIERSEDFRRYLEPILHADFTALRTWRPRDFPALSVPLVVLLGRQDTVPLEKGRDWERRTNGGFSLHVFDGGHFFPKNHGAALAALIAQELGRAT